MSLVFYKSKTAGDMNGLLSGYLIRKRFQAIAPYLDNKEKVFDIGCGVFRWKKALAPTTRYVGVDLLESVIDYNRQCFGHTFDCLDVEKDALDKYNSNFDMIIMAAVIEHFDNPLDVLKKLKATLKTGGQLVFTTPHPRGEKLLNIGSLFGFFSNDKHTHHDLLDQAIIEKLAVSAGYQLTSYKRFLAGLNQLVVLTKA
jgi:2-polyprenyl-3-methyl-5-hydroxy-6-metoxy-1,4-benzoquinol methylase